MLFLDNAKQRGRNIAVEGEFVHDNLVQPVRAWANAVARVEANHRPLPATEVWGWFYPSQKLLLSPTAEPRAAHYLMSPSA